MLIFDGGGSTRPENYTAHGFEIAMMSAQLQANPKLAKAGYWSCESDSLVPRNEQILIAATYRDGWSWWPWHWRARSDGNPCLLWELPCAWTGHVDWCRCGWQEGGSHVLSAAGSGSQHASQDFAGLAME